MLNAPPPALRRVTGASIALAFVLAAGLAGCTCEKNMGTDGGSCATGELLCNGNVLQTCDEAGNPVVTQDCAATGLVCVDGTGCRACVPNSLVCDGLDAYSCAADGMSNDYLMTCNAPGETCNAGTCVNACLLAEERRSNVGCTYWAVDLDNANVGLGLNAAAQQFAVVISNPSLTLADVTVTVNDAPSGAAISERVVDGATVAPGQLVVFQLDPREVDGSPPFEFDTGTHSAITSNAYKISSTAPIVAYQFNPLENANVFSNDASLLVPVEALDLTYRVLGWPQTLADVPGTPLIDGGRHLRATLTIVGVAEDTTFSVGLSTSIVGDGNTIPAANAGEIITFNIGPYDVVNLETGIFGGDFTGSNIMSDHPIAVFPGSEASDVPAWETLQTRLCCADHLEEQLFPLTTLGRNFVAAKSPERSPMVAAAGGFVTVVPEPEYWVILATSEGTTVRTSLPAPDDEFVLFEGASRVIESYEDFIISASGPLIVGQFMASQEATGISFDLPGGDPAFLLVPPVEQFRERYLFLTPDKYAFDFVVITRPVGSSVLLDDVPLEETPWLTDCSIAPAGALFDDNGAAIFWEAVRCQLSFPMVIPGGSPPDNILPGMQNDGVHVLEADVPVGLWVGGFDAFVSYAYAAGLNLERINIE